MENANYPDQVTLVDSWGLQLNIGSPPQPLCVEGSTAVNSTVIMTTSIRTNDHNSTFDQCVSRRGGLLDINGTSGYNTTSMNDLLDPGWASFNPPGITEFANTSFQFASDIPYC